MTKTTTHFSIVTITYNNDDGLFKTGRSIKAQAFTHYEWIIIDGAENVQCPNSFPAERVTLISEPDNGIYNAMNKGINNAKGDYIIFLNAGDQFVDENTLSNIALHNDDFIYGDSLEESITHQHYKKARSADDIELGMFTHHQAMVYKTSLIKNLRYNEDYKIAADYDFTCKFLKNSKTIKYIEHPICIFEAGGVSQVSVRQARIEQFKIRQSIGCFILKNIFIFSVQTMLYCIRQLSPKFYWFVKRARQTDNI